MEKFILSTDTCADRYKSDYNQNNIKYIEMKFIEESIIHSDNYNSEKEYANFYANLAKGIQYSTSGLNFAEVEEYFKSILENTNLDIVHISLSSGLSLTCGVVKSVAEQLNSVYKNKIYVVDSLSATCGENLVLETALNCRNNVLDAKTTVEICNDIVNHLDVSFFVSDMDCLKRGGRINGFSAMIGKLANIRPEIIFDEEGKLKVIAKHLGTKKALNSLFSKFKQNYSKELNSSVYIAYTDNKDLAMDLQNLIIAIAPAVKINLQQIGPVIGSHTGSSAIGLVFAGQKKRFK